MNCLGVAHLDMDSARRDACEDRAIAEVGRSFVKKEPPAPHILYEVRQKETGQAIQQTEEMWLKNLEGDVQRVDGYSNKGNAHGRCTSVVDLQTDHAPSEVQPHDGDQVIDHYCNRLSCLYYARSDVKKV